LQREAGCQGNHSSPLVGQLRAYFCPSRDLPFISFICRDIYRDRDTFVSMLWTAHGLWPPSPAPVTMAYRIVGEDVVRAIPRLSYFLSEKVLSRLRGELQAISIALYDVSL